ncbi:pyridoxamine 5'-phosphate oxidase family protein [Merismopedia glauca]|uniref:Pyridoxamine 5'-phosphate oxidase n=1 Tax=Merismopedia glauca CCAP 1448/3 TaxID=1296344 RepID=A0A2T1BZX6_9CYAN|nr:pyridoxamine 5'-phosphate oxidase family protein [Merismopedia glauca]PSB01561.1 pyridoxamine 5'-phosphate oxidase [Merismopedia glauca CCAP 1448/3]
MAKFYEQLNPELIDFIDRQKVFFTATAPTEGRINLSPKGMHTFKCIDSKKVAYLDVTGSGNETSAHLQENGKITIMMCSFSDEPLILRLYGQGKPVLPRNPTWETLLPLFKDTPGTRQIIVVHLESIQTSCGFGVPIYEFKEERQTLKKWAKNKGETGLREYWESKNQTSIDGLPTNILSETKIESDKWSF